jgi:DNA N-6-adenine-methyltransferase (Dam)
MALFDLKNEYTDNSNEWYTPWRYIEAAREVMGGIDLDPASCAAANQIIKATRFYTKEENGLMQPWHGNVWLNPPYGMHPSGKSNMAVWSQRLISHYEQGNVEQAILLSMVNTESSWFVDFWQFPICFPSPRVMFHRPDGTLDHHLQGSCFVYLGRDVQKFAEVFSKFGRVVPADMPKIKPANLELWSA